MASFRDITVKYIGTKPYAILRLVFQELTISAIIVVDYADKNYLALTVRHCNEDYVDVFISKAEAFATLSDAEIEIETLSENEKKEMM